MAAEVIAIPTPLAAEARRQREADEAAMGELFDLLVCALARAQRIEAAAAGFVAHVQMREQAGWNKVPKKPTMHGDVGFAQLVEALEP
jgi:hypothetical protein